MVHWPPLSFSQRDAHKGLSDSWSWNFEKNGLFSVRSAYKMLVATKQRREPWLEGTAATSNTAQEKSSWKSMWHVSVPGKIRMFLWRLARHSLPTEDVREHRNMSTSSSCGLCVAPAGGTRSWTALCHGVSGPLQTGSWPNNCGRQVNPAPNNGYSR